MTPQRYIHVRNWDRYQRFKDRRPHWVRLHFDLHRDEDYLNLTPHRRLMLIGLWIEYGMNVRADANGQFTQLRGLRHDTASLSRRLSQRVLSPDLETLNHAGFIVFSEHETVTSGDTIRPLDTQNVEIEKTLAPEAREDVGDFLDELEDELAQRRTKGKGSGSEAPATGSSSRPRDPVWDALTVLFGAVAEKTNAHARRNKAAADLRRLEATPELVRRAAARWPAVYPSANLTDVALATHYPQLALGMKPSTPPCVSCGVGGGSHAADCERARPALDLEGLEEFRDETEAA